MESAVASHFQKLETLFGKAAAHEISARCYAILSKYKEEGCGIPNGSSAYSLFSVALV